MTFKEALVFTLKWEGGISNHPKDTGGLTNMGILQTEYTAWLAEKGRPNKSVRDITRQEMEQIYTEYYWKPIRAQYVTDPLAQVLFDTAVNLGVGGCTRRLQIALGVKATGQWTQDISDRIHKVDQLKVALEICRLRIAKRYERIRKRDDQKVFLKGWLNRDYALIKEAKRLAGIASLSVEEDEGEDTLIDFYGSDLLDELDAEDEDRYPAVTE